MLFTVQPLHASALRSPSVRVYWCCCRCNQAAGPQCRAVQDSAPSNRRWLAEEAGGPEAEATSKGCKGPSESEEAWQGAFRLHSTFSSLVLQSPTLWCSPSPPPFITVRGLWLWLQASSDSDSDLSEESLTESDSGEDLPTDRSGRGSAASGALLEAATALR